MQVGKLPEAKQAGGGIIQQPVFWGIVLCQLLTEPVLGHSRDAGHWVLLEGTWQRVAGEGGGSGKEKRLAPDLFPHLSSHEALSLPSHHVAQPLFEPNGELSAQQGL